MKFYKKISVNALSEEELKNYQNEGLEEEIWWNNGYLVNLSITFVLLS